MKPTHRHIFFALSAVFIYGSVAIILWPVPQPVFAVLLAGALIYVTASDISGWIIPDIATAFLVLAGMGAIMADDPQLLAPHLLAGLVSGATLWGIAAGYSRIRGRDGLGLGDVKLFAAGAIWVGPWGVPLIVLSASASGLIFGFVRATLKRGDLNAPIPFGPFLALAIWIIWLAG